MRKTEEIVRSNRELRESMWDQIVKLRDGTGDPAAANALARKAGKIIKAERLELNRLMKAEGAAPRAQRRGGAAAKAARS
jgi:hypothetical protein